MLKDVRQSYSPRPPGNARPPALGFDVHVLADPHHATLADLKVIAQTDVRLAGIRSDFTPEEAAQASKAVPVVPIGEPGVVDLRHLLWSAIDNDNSKDPDQIEYAEKLPDGSTRLLVGVADVDCLVPKDSPGDKRAAQNMGTVYTPFGDTTMLSEEFATNKTVFVPHQDRQAVVTEMIVDANGKVTSSKIYRAVVNNHCQLAYNGVSDWLDHPDDAHQTPAMQGVDGIGEQLQLQQQVARQLRAARQANGALSFQNRSTVQPTSQNGTLVLAPAEVPNSAQQLVEDLMVTTNTVSAEFLAAQGYPAIRRVQMPTPDDWGQIVALAQHKGTALPSAPDSKALEQFMDGQRAVPGFDGLSTQISKLLGPAQYAVGLPNEPPVGQISMGVPMYVHTSGPNRLDVDLVNQRIIKAAIEGRPCPYTVEELQAIATRGNLGEKTIKGIEHQIQHSIDAVYMQDRVGESFDGVVSGANFKGAFVALDGTGVDGFLFGSKAAHGTPVHVTLQSVDIEKGRVNLALQTPPPT